MLRIYARSVPRVHGQVLLDDDATGWYSGINDRLVELRSSIRRVLSSSTSAILEFAISVEYLSKGL